MSTSENNVLMPVEDAQQVRQEVYNHVFFNKLASAGFPVRTPEEAEAVLRTSDRLRKAAAQVPTQKSASFFDAADSDLAAVLNEYGIAGEEKNADDELLQLAIGLAENSDIYRSVLTLDHYANQ